MFGSKRQKEQIALPEPKMGEPVSYADQLCAEMNRLNRQRNYRSRDSRVLASNAILDDQITDILRHALENDIVIVFSDKENKYTVYNKKVR